MYYICDVHSVGLRDISIVLTLLYSLQEFGVYGSFIYQPFSFALQGKAILDLMPQLAFGLPIAVSVSSGLVTTGLDHFFWLRTGQLTYEMVRPSLSSQDCRR